MPEHPKSSTSESGSDPATIVRSSRNHYRVGELLGEGGQAKVYLATEVETGRKVTLRSTLEAREQFTLRAHLRHPSLLRVVDFFDSFAESFLIEEFVPGTLLSEASLPGESLREVARQLLYALSYLHENRIVHRDIKPDNIILTRDSLPVLIDFGLARRFQSGSRGGSHKAGGTLGTTAPETLMGKDSGPATDLFALGTTLLATALGTQPDPRWSLDPKRLSLALSSSPPDIAPLLFGLVSEDSNHRYGSASEALRAIPDSSKISVTTPEAWPIVGQESVIKQALDELGQVHFNTDEDRQWILVIEGPEGSGRHTLGVALSKTMSLQHPQICVRTRDLTSSIDLFDFVRGTKGEGDSLHIAITSNPFLYQQCCHTEMRSKVVLVRPAPLGVSAVEALRRFIPISSRSETHQLVRESDGNPGALSQLIVPSSGGELDLPCEAEIYIALLDEPVDVQEFSEQEAPNSNDFEVAHSKSLVQWTRDGLYWIPNLMRRRWIAQNTPRADRTRIHSRLASRLPLNHGSLSLHRALGQSREKIPLVLDSLVDDLKHKPSPRLTGRFERILMDMTNEERVEHIEPLVRSAYAAARYTNNQSIEQLIETWQSVSAVDNPLVGALRARLFTESGDHKKAVDILVSALEDDSCPLLEPYLDLARASMILRRTDLTLDALSRAKTVCQPSTESHVEIERIRGLTLFRQGLIEEAIDVTHEAFRMIGDANSSLSLGLAMNLAMMERHRGDLESAEGRFASTAKALLEIGDLRTASLAWINSAIIAQDSGRLAIAQSRMRDARSIASDGGYAHPSAVAIGGLGITLKMRGHLGGAIQCLMQAELELKAQGLGREQQFARIHRLDAQLSIEESDEHAAELQSTFREMLALGRDEEAALAWWALTHHGMEDLLPISWSERRKLLRASARSVREEIRVSSMAARLKHKTRIKLTETHLTRLSNEGLPLTRLLACEAICAYTAERATARHAAAKALSLVRHWDSPAPKMRAALCAIEARLKVSGDRLVRLPLKLSESAIIEMKSLYVSEAPEDAVMISWTRRLEEMSRKVQSWLTSTTPAHTHTTDLLDPFFRCAEALHDETLTDRQRHEIILREAISISSASRGAIITRDLEGLETFEASQGESDFDLSRSLLDEVIDTGEARVTVNALEDPAFSSSRSVVEFHLASIACVPIKHGGRILGALYLDNPFATGVFDEATLNLLKIFATQIAMTLEAEWRRREILRLNGRLNEDLERTATELEKANSELAESRKVTPMIYASSKMVALVKTVRRLATTDLPVFIHGETGTGKELIAKRLHEQSPRRHKSFITENCAAIPAQLLESELFGHVKGAFSGADRDKPGLFRLAHLGTLFLDEIGDMPLDLQGKILRVLQEKRVRPVGADRTVEIDVRLITATHMDLQEMVKSGTFREDLFYRVHVAPVEIPSLRERKDDIPLLAAHFLSLYGTPNALFDDSAMTRFSSYAWPGNVRELESVVRSAAVLTHGERISDRDLPQNLRDQNLSHRSSSGLLPVTHLKELEKLAIHQALEDCGGNRNDAAKALGISRSSLFNKLKDDAINSTKKDSP